ncbi:MAG: ABC transporter ATP-binding protein [Actinomycetota bacterium]
MKASNWGLDRASVDYGGVKALEDVSVGLTDATVTAVAGGDGAGKTSLLRALLGLVALSAGEIRCPQEGAIGYLPAGSGVYPDLTVDENLRFAAGAYGLRGGDYRVARAELLARTGLAPAHDRLGGNLSGGMRQKLGLAMALVHGPRLLVLDEPSTGIDPVSRRELWRLVTEAAGDGTTVVLATTYLDEAQRCDSVTVLDDGAILLQGSPGELISGIDGSVGESAARPEITFAWRRGAGWRGWSPGDAGSAGARPVAPDLQDAVVIAALRKREAQKAAA